MDRKKELRNNYDAACNAYISELNKMWHVEGYWAGGAGEVYCFNEEESINMGDIILCVEEDIAHEEFKEWEDYCSFAYEFNQDKINFLSWHHGYRGVPKEEQETLRKLKEQFQEKIAECNEIY